MLVTVPLHFNLNQCKDILVKLLKWSIINIKKVRASETALKAIPIGMYFMFVICPLLVLLWVFLSSRGEKWLNQFILMGSFDSCHKHIWWSALHFSHQAKFYCKGTGIYFLEYVDLKHLVCSISAGIILSEAYLWLFGAPC